MSTATDISNHNFKNFYEASLWAKQNIVGCYKNKSTGIDITVSKKAIDKYLSSSAVLKSVSMDAHLSVLRILPYLIEDAILKEIHEDRDRNKDIKGILRFYSAINYQSQAYSVKITVKAYLTGNKAYSYEVIKKAR